MNNNKLRAFHNDPAVKAKYLARVEAHRLADEIVQGTGFEHNGETRGCAVGCTLDAYNHALYPVELGLPTWLAYLEDAIHEGLPLEKAKLWPGQFLEAIPVGASLEKVYWQVTAARMEKLLTLASLKTNEELYAWKCKEAIGNVIALAHNYLTTGNFLIQDLESATESATSAMDLAEMVWAGGHPRSDTPRSIRERRFAWSVALAARSARTITAGWQMVTSGGFAASGAESAASATAESARGESTGGESADVYLLLQEVVWQGEADTLLAFLRAA